MGIWEPRVTISDWEDGGVGLNSVQSGKVKRGILRSWLRSGTRTHKPPTRLEDRRGTPSVTSGSRHGGQRWYTGSMIEPKDRELPIAGQEDLESEPPDALPSCSPEVYVSNEEASLLAAMRRLQERASHIRGRLSDPLTDDQRTALSAELEELRTRRSELARRRDRAYRRKMVMLGHLPPDALLD